MPTATAQHDYVVFMEGYTDFLDRMLKDEGEKLAALSSNELPRIERSIAVSQANAKQLENYEQRRMGLQSAAGYDGLTFRELITKAPEEDKGLLQRLFARFEQDVTEIKHQNHKAMDVARDNMMARDPEAVLAAENESENPYNKMKKASAEQNSNILEAKV